MSLSPVTMRKLIRSGEPSGAGGGGEKLHSVDRLVASSVVFGVALLTVRTGHGRKLINIGIHC